MLRLTLWAVLFYALVCPLATAKAEEPAQAFLEALRDNGYYDVAIDYLDELEKGDLITDEFRSSLPFEKAEVLIGSTKELRDLEVIETRLDEAQKLLTAYASKNQSLEVSARTLTYQGNLLFQRSNIYIKQAKQDRATESERNELHGKSRSMLTQSLDSYKQAKDQTRKLIDPNSPQAIKIDPDDPSTGRKRKRLQNSYTEIRLRLPMVTEQLADTYPTSSPDGKKYLTEAAGVYKDVYDDYRRYHAGLKACVFSARCQEKLGKHKPALDLLGEIFDLGNNSSLKPLKLEAYVLAAKCWAKMDPYPHVEVIKRLEPAVKVLNRVEIRKPEWLRVQMELAIAKHKSAESIRAKGGPKANNNAGVVDREGARILRSIARVPSEYREKAKGLLEQWNVPMVGKVEAESKVPTNFADARQKAKDMISDLEIAAGEASALRRKFKATKDPTAKQEFQTQYSDAMLKVRTQSQDSLDALNLALELADDTVIRADINNVRYLQSYCYFASQQYFESAVIGEYLLEKYPTVAGTQQAMSLMIQSYSSMLDAAKDEDSSFEQERLLSSCDSVLQRWPGSNEAGTAASTLTRLSLNKKDFATAEKYFLQIPTDAPYRNALGVRLGQRVWMDLKKKISAGEDVASLIDPIANAKKYMAEGVANSDVAQLDYETALGALMLVDAHLAVGEIDEAVNQLESASIAPLDLVKQKHPAITRSALGGIYVRETYRSAIKTYLAAMKASEDKQTWINKASGVIAAMRQGMEATGDPKDRASVTTIYRMIAKELKDDFDALKSKDEKKKFASSLETFLGSIESDAEDAKTVLWAGSTLRSVGDSLVESGLQAESKSMFKKAVAAFDKAEKLGFASEGAAGVGLVLELKRQRALSQRGAGNFEVAVNQLSDILKENPNAINVQIDTCKTLQALGKSANRAQSYIDATKGARPIKDPKTGRSKKLIWGWEKITKATRKNEKFRSIYYEALYHVAECRMEYGILAKKPGAIESAGKEIANELKRDPTFSGMGQWKKKFAQLQSRINAAK